MKRYLQMLSDAFAAFGQGVPLTEIPDFVDFRDVERRAKRALSDY